MKAQEIDYGRIVSSLRDGLGAERIYLFGSRARGDFCQDSDIDIYATVPDTDESWIHLSADARGLLSWLDGPKDVIVRTTASFDERASTFATLENIIANEGVLLYG